MNQAHLEFCSSPEWARLIEDELLSWVLDGWELGDDLLEVGPGPGLTTDVLRHLAELARVLQPGGVLAGADGRGWTWPVTGSGSRLSA
jgi:hypothetical protein